MKYDPHSRAKTIIARPAQIIGFSITRAVL
jgi:hypothetical protein